jgi:hypothetical protein
MISSSLSARPAEMERSTTGLPAITSTDGLMRDILQGLHRHHPAGTPANASALPDLNGWETGATIRFGAGSPGTRWLSKGWSQPEAGYVWSDGHRAELLIPACPAAEATLLNFELSPFTHASGVTQNIRISSRNRLVAVWDFAQQGHACLILPRPAKAEEPIKLEWEFPNARSPREVGMNGDLRKLGIALFSVTLYSLKSFSTGQK